MKESDFRIVGYIYPGSQEEKGGQDECFNFYGVWNFTF